MAHLHRTRGGRTSVGLAILVGCVVLGAWWFVGPGRGREASIAEITEPPQAPSTPHEPGRAATSSSTPEPLTESTSNTRVPATTPRTLPPESLNDLPPGTGIGRLSGHVEDSDGNPMAGATVNVQCDACDGRDFLSDEQGRYTIDSVAGEFVVEAMHEGSISIAHAEGEILEGEHLEHMRLILAPTRTVHGIVIDQDGNPVSECAVSFELEPEAYHMGLSTFDVVGRGTRTARDGRFELRNVPAAPLELGLYHAMYRAKLQLVGASTNEVQLILGPRHRRAKLIGQVFSSEGTPAPGIEVTITGGWRAPTPTTDAEGRFTAPMYVPGEGDRHERRPLQIFIHDENHGLHHEIHPPLEAGTTEIEIQLRPALELAGVVLAADGTPVPKALIQLGCEEELSSQRTLLQAADLAYEATDEAGRFHFGQLWNTEFTLGVRIPGQPGIRAELKTRAGRDDVILRLGQGLDDKVRFVVRVTGHARGAPLAHPEFSLHSKRSWSGRSARPLGGGRWEVIAGEPGTWGLTVDHEGFAPHFVPRTTYEAGAQELEVSLWPARPFLLRVLDEEGRPAGGAQILVRSAEGERLVIDNGITGHDEYEPCLVGPNGYLRFPLLPRRPLDFEVVLREELRSRTPFDLTGSEPRSAEIRL